MDDFCYLITLHDSRRRASVPGRPSPDQRATQYRPAALASAAAAADGVFARSLSGDFSRREPKLLSICSIPFLALGRLKTAAHRRLQPAPRICRRAINRKHLQRSPVNYRAESGRMRLTLIPVGFTITVAFIPGRPRGCRTGFLERKEFLAERPRRSARVAVQVPEGNIGT